MHSSSWRYLSKTSTTLSDNSNNMTSVSLATAAVGLCVLAITVSGQILPENNISKSTEIMTDVLLKVCWQLQVWVYIREKWFDFKRIEIYHRELIWTCTLYVCIHSPSMLTPIFLSTVRLFKNLIFGNFLMITLYVLLKSHIFKFLTFFWVLEG